MGFEPMKRRTSYRTIKPAPSTAQATLERFALSAISWMRKSYAPAVIEASALVVSTLGSALHLFTTLSAPLEPVVVIHNQNPPDSHRD